MKISSEYDSEEQLFTNKISWKLPKGLAKIKASCKSTLNGDLTDRVVGVFSKFLDLQYDVEERAAMLALTADVGDNLSLWCHHDVKAQVSSMAALLKAPDERFSAELSFGGRPGDRFPNTLMSSCLRFPDGELRHVRVAKEEGEPTGLTGVVRPDFKTGSAMVAFDEADRMLSLRYTYKDESITLSPAVVLPAGNVQVNFKRRFNESHKLSLMYDLQDVTFSSVYKITPHPHLKAKLGYDSNARLAWGSLWIGSESDGAKNAPRKTKIQVMLQVPQDDISSSCVLFKVKKRIDIL